MTIKAAFTAEEWNRLLSAPTVVALYVVLSSPGIVESIKESMPVARAMARAATEANAPNELMGALFAEFKNTEALKQAQPRFEIRDAAQVKGEVLDSIRRVGQLLDSKATREEAHAYKAWLYQVAVDAATAAKEADSSGIFLGSGGKHIRDEEAAALQEIAGALNLQTESS